MTRKHTTTDADPWALVWLLLRGAFGLGFILAALLLANSFFNALKTLQPQPPEKTYLHNPAKNVIAKSN